MTAPIDTRNCWVVTFETGQRPWILFSDTKEEAIEYVAEDWPNRTIADVEADQIVVAQKAALQYKRHRIVEKVFADMGVSWWETACGKKVGDSWKWDLWSEYGPQPAFLCPDCFPDLAM